MAKKTGIHPNLTRELILLHEKAEKIIDVRENIDLWKVEEHNFHHVLIRWKIFAFGRITVGSRAKTIHIRHFR